MRTRSDRTTLSHTGAIHFFMAQYVALIADGVAEIFNTISSRAPRTIRGFHCSPSCHHVRVPTEATADDATLVQTVVCRGGSHFVYDRNGNTDTEEFVRRLRGIPGMVAAHLGHLEPDRYRIASVEIERVADHLYEYKVTIDMAMRPSLRARD